MFLTSADPRKTLKLAAYRWPLVEFIPYIDMTGNSRWYAPVKWGLTRTHTHTGAAPACQSSNASHRPVVYEANVERSIVCRGVMRYLPVLFEACQLRGAGLAPQWNAGENQINLSLLTVAGFWSHLRVGNTIYFVCVSMATACGWRRRHGLVWDTHPPHTHRKKKRRVAQAKQLFCFETVQDRAVTRCFYRAAHLFFAEALEGWQHKAREGKDDDGRDSVLLHGLAQKWEHFNPVWVFVCAHYLSPLCLFLKHFLLHFYFGIIFTSGRTALDCERVCVSLALVAYRQPPTGSCLRPERPSDAPCFSRSVLALWTPWSSLFIPHNPD